MGLTKFELFCPKDFSRYAKLLWNDGLGGERVRRGRVQRLD